MLSKSSEEVALELLPKAAAPTASARIACMLYMLRASFARLEF
jgi:hypothetical protein